MGDIVVGTAPRSRRRSTVVQQPVARTPQPGAVRWCRPSCRSRSDTLQRSWPSTSQVMASGLASAACKATCTESSAGRGVGSDAVASHRRQNIHQLVARPRCMRRLCSAASLPSRGAISCMAATRGRILRSLDPAARCAPWHRQRAPAVPVGARRSASTWANAMRRQVQHAGATPVTARGTCAPPCSSICCSSIARLLQQLVRSPRSRPAWPCRRRSSSGA